MTEECESMKLESTASGHEGSREKTVPAPGHTPGPGRSACTGSGGRQHLQLQPGPRAAGMFQNPRATRRRREGWEGTKRMLF